MIPDTELKKLHDLIIKADNPLYLFDDDPDGLCSFLIFWRATKKGKGIALKGKPTKDTIMKNLQRTNDLLVILDKPVLEDEALDEVGIPIVYLDHHPINHITKENFYYFNPKFQDSEDELSTAYWAYKAMKTDLWLSAVGTISDWHIPDYINEIQTQFPDIFTNIDNPGEAIFNSPFGRLSKTFLFSLKGSSDITKQCIKILTRIESPYEILNQTTPQGKYIYKHYEKMNVKYEKAIEEASKHIDGEQFLIYIYHSTEDSFTSIISNELVYRNPNRIIIIARMKGEKVSISMRSWKLNLPPIVKKSLEGIQGSGGGHLHACGAVINANDLDIFINNFKKHALEELNKK
ncbi:DHH family phosphoesterase [Candidatus Woesearchaeota archaeon]|nr:DHH family phosphoesterase [Candidatus Woesearchaeota archaeon]